MSTLIAQAQKELHSYHKIGEFDLDAHVNLSAKIRKALGIERLTREQSAIVHGIVALHNSRAIRNARTIERPGRFAAMLADRIQADVEYRYVNGYKTAAGGWADAETYVKVSVGPVPCATTRTSTAWSRNGKWRGTNLSTTITVSSRWRSVVMADGIAVAAGLLTLDAERIEDGLWSATWIEQGRGFSLKVKSGYIARLEDGTYYHAATLNAAKRASKASIEANRQAATARAQARKSRLLEIAALDVATIATRYGDVVVTVKDSTRGGNCVSGTRSWVERYADGRDSGTVREILEVVPNPDTYVRRALAAAIMRAS